ncbi:HNH endonuclease [Dolichospermum sp. UHCC 0259]|uniref:HNH endonuclease n=1 Tax=Dolichospermum sp. UHCC 0259 TaxID=2590010 RepID=UPI0014488CD1|nr:HNH endonuclease signature motif containing protein [Dolichospermum sp. UHCC 0259]MTJ47974.1 HNH endonuclease [Dolichospermum sp. UHCC 0259]
MTDNKLKAQIKADVRLRAKNCCEYCYSQEKFSTHSFSVEHIQPISKGGNNNLDNLALSCQGCNNYKYNKTEGKDPITQSMVSLYHPRQQNWQEHFSWNQDYTLIIGLTSIGRTTVEVLRLNREGLVNLRNILYRMAEHPPSV